MTRTRHVRWIGFATEQNGQSRSEEGVRVVHQLHVEVGLGRVARVAALGDPLPGPDPFTVLHADRVPAQVCQHGVLPTAAVDDDVVSEDLARSEELANALDQQVHERRPGRPAPVITMPSRRTNDRPVRW